MSTDTLKAPFPYFGGKSRVAPLVWERFGDVPAYVEPFFGSGACLLGRPVEHAARTETVNDIDCFLANFWRALQHEPEAVAEYADWPVNEVDLEARHGWLVTNATFRERMKADPEFYDVKVAGWWVWGISQWIGSGWCSEKKYKKRPHLGDGRGVHRQRPHLGNDGRGVHRQLPHLGNDGRGGLVAYFRQLAARLRRVRVCCGDWQRIMAETAIGLHHNPTVGVFLDPPYADTANRTADLYANDCEQVAHTVREWAIAHGDDKRYRIALCGYEGEHELPESWECVAWKAHGGYGHQGNNQAKANSHRERIWFSPHCLRPSQGSLF